MSDVAPHDAGAAGGPWLRSASGDQVEVRRSARRKRTVSAHREDGRIVVLLPARLSRAEETAWVERMVAKVHAREAKVRGPGGDAELEARAAELLETYLLPHVSTPRRPTSVAWVSNMNHRWGSCTTGVGTIRLSDRLRPMPAWVVDYVLIHELAHLFEREHSPRFWRLVGAYAKAEKAQGYLVGWSDAAALIGPGPSPAQDD
ncbi:YgjP-like metallopeptidase domain-containing protein [Mariniluteicoccus flavus]